MSDERDWDRYWWKKDRDESLERKSAAKAAASGVNPGDSFLIVTEGTVTEPLYFELFLKTLSLSRVKIKVVPARASDPRNVIQTARDLAAEQVSRSERRELGINEPSMFDHVWAVIDTDVAVRNGIWNDVLQLANARGVSLAHSTPCFEFWLLLHLVETFTTRGDLTDGAAAKAAVKMALGQGYSTNAEVAREAITSFIDAWPKAVNHAEKVRRHHAAAATPSPGNPSTEVDLLARALNDSTPPHRRRLECK